MIQSGEKRQSSDINTSDDQAKREDNKQLKQQMSESSASIPMAAQPSAVNIDTSGGVSGFDDGSSLGRTSDPSRRSENEQVPSEVSSRPRGNDI